MPYIIAYPHTLDTYRTIKAAEQAARDRIQAMTDAADKKGRSRKPIPDVEIHHVKYVTAFEAEDDEPGNDGAPATREGTG